MWVLAVAQAVYFPEGHYEAGRETGGSRPGKFRGYGPVVGGGMGEGFDGQLFFQLEGKGACPRAEGRQRRAVVGRRSQHGYRLVVLGGRAQQGHAADVYVLYQFFGPGSRFFSRLGEGVKVDHDHVQGLYAEFEDRLDVHGVVPPVEYTAVHGRVQGLHPTV